jgi:ATP-dependent Lon protease
METQEEPNKHGMITRSKCIQRSTPPMDTIEYEDLDTRGNLRDFIVDDFMTPPPEHAVTDPARPPKRSRKPKKTHQAHSNMNKLLMSLLLMKATEKANGELQTRRKGKAGSRVRKEVDTERGEDTDDDTLSVISSSSRHTSRSVKNRILVDEYDMEDTEDTGFHETLTDGTLTEDETRVGSGSETATDSEEESEGFEYDELDEEYEELLETHASLDTEEKDMEYYHHLSPEKKKTLLTMTKDIYELHGSHVPLRFKVIESHMDMKTKSIAMENIDKLGDMDVSTGEYSKMDHWVNGLLKIPFGTHQGLTVGPEHSREEKQTYLKEAFQTLNRAIYGHLEAKTHILQVLGKWIQNPESGGNVLAIQGPMGNGKTTLVKDGIAKVLNRPFAFIALGGASDSAFFDGHCYTYEGSHWGRIVQVLHDSKCMNPVFYFDELDKVSDTQKGEEIIHMLTHLTDSSQNSLFQDNYFPGINLDLSKALFIFSYNDEARVNKILKDRMYVIHTKGFKDEDKLKIFHEYLYPNILKTYLLDLSDIVFTDDILRYIIGTYTEKEEGVRNLKRCVETIVSKVNIYMMTHDDSTMETLSFTIKEFKLPLTLTRDHVNALLIKGPDTKVPFGMYC